MDFPDLCIKEPQNVYYLANLAPRTILQQKNETLTYFFCFRFLRYSFCFASISRLLAIDEALVKEAELVSIYKINSLEIN